MPRSSSALLALALLAACGPASVSGTVAGESIDSSDAIAEKTSVPVVGDSLHVVIGGDTSDLCADFSQGILRKSSSRLEFTLLKLGKSLAPGAYPIKDGAIAAATKLDSACGDVLTRVASGGTVTITSIEAATIEGTFDLTFDADHVEGSFSAALCSNSSTRLQSCK